MARLPFYPPKLVVDGGYYISRLPKIQFTF